MTLAELDTTVQELRLEADRGAFIDKLRQIVTELGAIPDAAPGAITPEGARRLRELVDETVEAIERRIDAQLDGQNVQQQLAGTVYELRRRMEAVNGWIRHHAPPP